MTFVSDVTFLVLEAGESATGVRPSLDPRAGNALVGVALSGGRVVARGAVAYGVGDDGQITPQPWPHQLDVGATLGGEIVDRLMQALDRARLHPAGDAEHLRAALGRLARWRALVEIDATLEARLFAGPTTGLTAL